MAGSTTEDRQVELAKPFRVSEDVDLDDLAVPYRDASDRERLMMGTESRGASNAKAKRELGWTLRYPSWTQGFVEVYSRPPASTTPPIRALRSE